MFQSSVVLVLNSRIKKRKGNMRNRRRIVANVPARILATLSIFQVVREVRVSQSLSINFSTVLNFHEFSTLDNQSFQWISLIG